MTLTSATASQSRRPPGPASSLTLPKTQDSNFVHVVAAVPGDERFVPGAVPVEVLAEVVTAGASLGLAMTTSGPPTSPGPAVLPAGYDSSALLLLLMAAFPWSTFLHPPVSMATATPRGSPHRLISCWCVAHHLVVGILLRLLRAGTDIRVTGSVTDSPGDVVVSQKTVGER